MKFCNYTPLLSYLTFKHPIQWDKVFKNRAPLDVEIGFGHGDFLIRSARENRLRNFIGLEQNWESVFKALRKIMSVNGAASSRSKIKNIRIVRFDARLVFEKSFKEKSIDRIYCLFPCPWPKKGHIKHRLFSQDFLRLVNSRLKDGGEIRIVTDFGPYYEWILEQLPGTGFIIETKKVNPQFETKYERKWLRAGIKEFFEIYLKKEKHFENPVKKEIRMKAFKLSKFDPEKFNFVDKTGETTIVLKEKLYDSKKEKMMLRFLVAEQNLLQPFWVMIFKKHNVWRVCKADGQTFFPTPGVNQTVELAYQAAKKSE